MSNDTDETMATVFAVMVPDGPLTQGVIDSLRQLFEGRLIAEFADLPAHKIAAEIIARGENANFPKDTVPVKAARALLEFMREAEFIGAPGRAEQPPIKVVLDQGPAGMSLAELLELLAQQPSRYDELLTHIEEQDDVCRACWKTPNWAITNPDGSLNVTATLGYIGHLKKTLSMPLGRVGGRRPTTLARVFGQEERPLFNPLFAQPSEMAVTGPIMDDYDLGNLPEELHLALIWGRRTKHEAWPQLIDRFQHVPEVFQDELPLRWQRILDDYREAKAAGEASTEGLSRYASETIIRAMGGGAVPFVVTADEPEHTEEWYREQLEDAAQARIRSGSGDIRCRRGIYMSLQTGSGDISLDDVIVLGNIFTGSGDLRGTVYIPKDCRAQTGSGDQSAKVYALSYKKLYEKAMELGLLD